MVITSRSIIRISGHKRQRKSEQRTSLVLIFSQQVFIHMAENAYIKRYE